MKLQQVQATQIGKQKNLLQRLLEKLGFKNKEIDPANENDIESFTTMGQVADLTRREAKKIHQHA